MEEHPLVREVYPELAAELARLLEAEGERYLAILAHDLRWFGECGCKDDFCQSFYTSDKFPPGTPYGEGHRNVLLDPEEGMFILDVVHERIVYVEVLFHPPLIRRDVSG